MRALLDAGADTDHALNRTTPLYIAAFHGHDAIVRALLGAGADKDLAKNNGDTPLFIAAGFGHDAIVRALLDAGADKDLATNDGATPLFIACQTNSTESCNQDCVIATNTNFLEAFVNSAKPTGNLRAVCIAQFIW